MPSANTKPMGRGMSGLRTLEASPDILAVLSRLSGSGRSAYMDLALEKKGGRS